MKRASLLSLLLAVALLLTSIGIAPPAMAGAEPAPDPYALIRQKQYEVLTGSGTYDPAAPPAEIQSKITQLDALTDGHAASMNLSPQRAWLWEDLKNGANPVVEGEAFAGSSTESVAYSYSRLVVMATTYRTPGSKWYGNPELAGMILGGMDFLYANWYNLTRDFSGANWWYLKIDIPGKINNVTVLMYDLLTPQQLQNYMNAEDRYVPHIVDDSPAAASGENIGANAVWKGFRVLLSGALTGNPQKIAEARDKLSESFEYVESGDGMQADYSFLQHAWNPYNLSYGMSSLTDIVNTLYVLEGTPWYPTDPNLERIFEWVEKAYEPFIANGLGMGMVEGRAVARARASEQSPFNLVNTVSRMISFAPEEYVPRLKSIVKTIMSSVDLVYYRQYSSILDIKLSNDIYTDAAVPIKPQAAEHLRFPGMDRVVHRNSSFTAGLAMHSTRTKNFEANGEFKTGWNIANGMTYVYTPNDRLQFTDKFWFTVDPDKLPGTTVNTRPRPLEINGVSVDMWNDHPYMSKPFVAGNPMNWTGGTDLGAYGAAGMQLAGVMNTGINAEQAKKELMAKKSWFMFDNEVVALGADISSSEGSPIQTIIENRRLSAAGDDSFIVDGVEQPGGPFEETANGASWMHLAPMGGYYFPQPETLELARYSRSGNLGSISLQGNPDAPKITENYLSIILDHGANISGKGYEYVLLPASTAQETAAYADDPDVDIQANTAKVQAVRENRLGITAANFWTNEVTAAGGLKANAKSSVMMQEQGGKLAVSISDPTQANTGNILLAINRSAASLIGSNPRIEVISLQPTVVVGVNVQGLKGQSVHFELAGAGAGVDEAVFQADLDMGLAARQLDVRMAVKNARSFLAEASIGYADGQYPPAARNALEAAAAQAEPFAADPNLGEAQKQGIVRGLEVALQQFKASLVQSSLRIGADADTSVQFNNAAGLGSATEIMVKTDNTGWFGGTRAGFLRFALGDNGAVIKSARLSVITRIAEATTALPPLTIRRVADNSWSEQGMTYSTMPPYSAEAVAEATPSSKNPVETQFDVTGYIADSLDNGMVSVAIVQVPLPPIVAPDTPNNDNTSPLYRISARESGAASAPKLIIEYETLEGALAHAGEAIGRIPEEMASSLLAAKTALEAEMAAGEELLGDAAAGNEAVRTAILRLMQKNGVIDQALQTAADSEPPGAPQALTGKVQKADILLQWTASSDNIGVAGYDIYRNQAKIAHVAETEYLDVNPGKGLLHAYFVRAVDTAGNESAASNRVELAIPSDPDIAERQAAVASAIGSVRETLSVSPVGYGIGQYPPQAAARLEQAVAAAEPYSTKADLSEAEKAAAIGQLELACKSFLLSRVASSATVPVDADTAVRVNYGENHGSAAVLPIKTDPTWAGGNRIALLRFIVGNNGYLLKKATLLVQGNVNDSNPSTDIPPLAVHAVADNSWSETGVTYATMPEMGQLVAAAVPSSRAQAETGFDITGYLSGSLENGAVSMALVQQTLSSGNQGLYYQITAKEASYSTARAPRIELEYDLPATLEAALEAARAAANRLPANSAEDLSGLRSALAAGAAAAEALLAGPEADSGEYMRSIASLRALADQANSVVLPPHSPAAPQNVTGAVYGTVIQLHWDAAWDAAGTVTYAVYRNGAQLALTTLPAYTDNAVFAGNHYIYTVVAIDAAGNMSSASQPVALYVPHPAGPEEPQQEDPAPSPPAPKEEPAADPHTAVIRPEELEQLAARGTAFLLEDGRTTLILPGNSGALLQGRPLAVQTGSLRLKLPAAVLSSGEELAGDRQYLLDVVPAAGVKTDRRQAGPVVELGLQLRDGQGLERVSAFAEPVSLMLKVDPDRVDVRLIGVYRQEPNGQWEYVGGRYDSALQEISVGIAVPGRYAVLEYNESYSDVPSAHWAYDSLKILTSRHIISGTGSGEFHPEASVTRAEFTAMLVRLLDLPAAGKEAGFRDVSPDDWHYGLVQAAKAAGLIQGDETGSFRPGQALTREEMAALLVRAYEYAAGGKPSGGGALADYRDGPDVSPWARPFVEGAIASGIMQGRDDGVFHPQGAASRAESAQAILNLLTRMNRFHSE